MGKQGYMDESSEILLFKTNRQRTWILISNFRFFCILNDIAKDSFIIRWQLGRDEIMRNEVFILPIKIDPIYKKDSGLIDFGPNHKKWLYSKSILPTEKILRDEITKEVVHKMK